MSQARCCHFCWPKKMVSFLSVWRRWRHSNQMAIGDASEPALIWRPGVQGAGVRMAMNSGGDRERFPTMLIIWTFELCGYWSFIMHCSASHHSIMAVHYGSSHRPTSQRLQSLAWNVSSESSIVCGRPFSVSLLPVRLLHVIVDTEQYWVPFMESWHWRCLLSMGCFLFVWFRTSPSHRSSLSETIPQSHHLNCFN